jgi:signal peptidase I
MGLNVTTRRSDGWWDYLKFILQAVAIAFVFRYAFYQPFNIPSGSMKPTLLVGDYLFVSKLSYGYSKYTVTWRGWKMFNFAGRVFSAPPKRGDVAVFRLPRDPEIDYIKRVIGLPGDEIRMQAGVLYINGKPVPRRKVSDIVTREDASGPPQKFAVYEETLPEGRTYTVMNTDPSGSFNNVGPYRVPANHYFMMGDNRDNSTDSRASWGVGYVPFENFIGRAEIIFFSGESDEPNAFRILAPWTWPFDVRWSRFFNAVR